MGNFTDYSHFAHVLLFTESDILLWTIPGPHQCLESVQLQVFSVSVMSSPLSHIKVLLLHLSLLCSQWNLTLVDFCTLLVPTRAMSWCTIWGLACYMLDGQFKLSTVSLRLSRSTTWIHGFGCGWLSVVSWHIKQLVTHLFISDVHIVCDCARINASSQMKLSSTGF